jgi:hypothetical protein
VTQAQTQSAASNQEKCESFWEQETDMDDEEEGQDNKAVSTGWA